MALYGAGLPLVKAATWLTHVELDHTSPFDRALINEFEPGRRLAALIPGARIVPLEGNNQIPFEDEPAWAAFVQQLRAFLGTEGRPPPPR